MQRIAVYAVIRDEAGRLLLVRSADTGEWWLPGGGVEHGEHPEEALRREAVEETGLEVEVGALRDVRSDVTDVAGVAVHSVRLVYEAVVAGGVLRHEQAGTTEEAAWLQPAAVARLPLAPNLAAVIRGSAGRA